MVAIDMCGKSPIMVEQIYEITGRHVCFNSVVLVIADTTSILKLVFPTVYCFCLDGYVGGCAVVAIIAITTYLFIYLLFFCPFDCYSYFCCRCCIATIAFVAGVIIAFCVCLVIDVANLMLMFPILVLLFMPYFIVNSADK